MPDARDETALQESASAPAKPSRPNKVLGLHARLKVTFEYPVRFTHGLLDPTNGCLREVIRRRRGGPPERLLAIIDAGLARAAPALPEQLGLYAEHHRNDLQLVAEPWVVEGGEACKNDPELLQRLLARIDAHHLDRHAFVLAMGGGALLDLVGLAASLAHRGLRLVRAPSTVLSQADGGVGVKNGVNAFGKKNFIGCFAPPHAVVCDLRLLATLPARERRAGMAEAVKVALVRDASFFAWIEDNAAPLAAGDARLLEALVMRSASLHLAHITGGGDPFERGSGRPLDFGHWAAHKLESMTAAALRHGEAVAIGIAIDAAYSMLSGTLAGAQIERIIAVLRQLGLPTWHPTLEARCDDGRRAVLRGLGEFREHLGGPLTLTLLCAAGRAFETSEVRIDTMERAIDWLREHA